jgi:hypothetical protein
VGLYGDPGTVLDPAFDAAADESAAEGQPAATKFAVAATAITDADIRCSGKVPVRGEPGEFKSCNRLLARLAGRPWIIQCPRCKVTNRSPVE